MKEALFWTSVLVLMYSIESKEILADFSDGCVLPLLKPFLPNIRLVNTIGFCQEENGATQYISSYDIDYNMAVFSAAIVETPTGDRGPRTAWSQGLGNKQPTWRPTDDDYAPFDDFNKGHLFTFSHSKDAHQAKSTMRLTNAVPQDRVFNQQVWSKAEIHLKENFINVCNAKNNHKSIVVTGAVPAYFGGGRTKPGSLIRIGVTQNSRFNAPSYEPLPKIDYNTLVGQLNTHLEERLTVPTHMWTYFACVNELNGRVTSQTSYIGMNYRTGVIKWYKKFEDFANTLKKMYHSTSTTSTSSTQYDIFTPELLSAMVVESNDEGPVTTKFCEKGKSLNLKSMKCDQPSAAGESEFWDNVNINRIRKKNEERRLNFLLALYGRDFKSENGIRITFQADQTSVGTVESDIDMRRKRSANRVEEEEPNIKPFGTLSMMDQDPNSDFELSSCDIISHYCHLLRHHSDSIQPLAAVWI